MLFKKPCVLWIAAAFMFLSMSAVAQSALDHVEKCGQTITTSEELKDEKFARSFFALQDAVMSKRVNNYPKEIPTLIHVINDQYNLTEAEILNEFDYLNEQFALNNTNISFCLKEVRFHEEEDLNSWCGNPIYCYNSVQNEIGENTGDIMEVYIGEWSGGTLGFTSLPPAGTGVWVRATEVVDPDSKTFTHEAGHWSGLLHTFSSNLYGGNYSCTSALNETDCVYQGDRVCDTPPTAVDWSCNDACPDIDEVDESYMSYAPDDCQDLFTPGQINRMHAQLELGRNAAINNSCCDNGPCPTDLTGDGKTNVQDFLVLLTQQGLTGDCLPADFDGDGIVGASDIVEMFQYYGTYCDGTEIAEQFNTKDLLIMLENDLINIYWTDVYGRVYNEYGDLAPGVYIQVEEYIDGQIISRKIFIN